MVKDKSFMIYYHIIVMWSTSLTILCCNVVLLFVLELYIKSLLFARNYVAHRHILHDMHRLY